jgi:hypothetical protein
MAGGHPGRRTRRRLIRGPVAVALTLAAGLTGCSSDEPTAAAGGQTPPSATASALTGTGTGTGSETGSDTGGAAASSPGTSTGSAAAGSATAPSAPAARPTTKSAEAFVRYFWNVYNYSYEALDPGPLSLISTAACTFCQSTVSEISGLKNARKHSTGGDIRARGVAAAAGDPRKGLIVTMTLDQEPGKTLNADGTVNSNLRAAHDIRSEVAVLWQATRWVVYGVANDEKTETP